MTRRRIHPLPYEVVFYPAGQHRATSIQTHSLSEATETWRRLRDQGREPTVFLGGLELDVSDFAEVPA